MNTISKVVGGYDKRMSVGFFQKKFLFHQDAKHHHMFDRYNPNFFDYLDDAIY